MTKPVSPWWPRPCQASVLKPGSLGAFSPGTVCTRPGFCQFLYPARSAEMDRRVLKHPVKPTKRETTAVLKAITLSRIPTSLPPPCARVCLRTSLQATFLLFNLVISPGFWALSQTAEPQICVSVLTAGNTNLLGHDEEKGNVLLCFTACHATPACRRWTVCQPRQTETAGTNSTTGYQKVPWRQHASNCPLTDDGQCFGDTPVVSPMVLKPLVGHSSSKYLPESTTRTWCW